MPRIVLIGAGSVEFTRNLLGDILTFPELADAEMGDPSITARAIQDRIRAAETFDQVFKAQSLPSWQEYEGEVVSVLAFHLNPSSFEGEGTSAAYGVVELGIPETGEIVTVQTGGGNVLMQLVKAWEKGWFPFTARLVVKDTKTPGRKTLWLEKVDG